MGVDLLVERNVVETIELTVPGMTCGHCEAAVTSEVTKIPGVSAVLVDLAAKTVTVTGSAISPEALRAAIDEAGFEVA